MWRKHAASLIEGIRLREPEGGISLSHTLEEQIRGQLQAGFQLVDCYDNGIKVDRMKILGYMISNGLIALSGALLAQNNGYADMNMGTGTIVNGLAAIILAEVIVKYLPLGKRLWSIVVGAVLYRLVLVMILAMNVDAQMLKLASAILLAIILYVPEVRQKLKIRPNKSLTPGGDK